MRLTDENLAQIELAGHRFVDSQNLRNIATALNTLKEYGDFINPDTLCVQLHACVRDFIYEIRQLEEIDKTKRYSFEKAVYGCELAYQLINPIITPDITEENNIDVIVDRSRWYLDIGFREGNIKEILEDKHIFYR